MRALTRTGAEGMNRAGELIYETWQKENSSIIFGELGEESIKDITRILNQSWGINRSKG